MEVEGNRPFEVLGVPLDADDREVRQAYAAKLREAKAGGDMDLVSEVQRAFEILRDENARRTARAVAEKEAELKRVLGAVDEALQNGETEAAVASLQRALELVPDYPPAVSLLLQIEGSRGNHAAAAELAERLVQANPQDHSKWKLLAWIHCERATNAASPGVRRLAFEQALLAIRNAQDLGSRERETVLLDAQILWGLSKGTEALQLVEKLAGEIAEFRPADMEVLFFLLRGYAAEGNRVQFLATVKRTAGLLPPDGETRATALEGLVGLCESMPPGLGDLKADFARFLETLLPGDSRINGIVIAALKEHQDFKDALDREVTAPAAGPEPKSSSFGGFGCGGFIVVWLLINLVRMCARDATRSENYPRPGGRSEYYRERYLPEGQRRGSWQPPARGKGSKIELTPGVPPRREMPSARPLPPAVEPAPRNSVPPGTGSTGPSDPRRRPRSRNRSRWGSGPRPPPWSIGA